MGIRADSGGGKWKGAPLERRGMWNPLGEITGAPTSGYEFTQEDASIGKSAPFAPWSSDEDTEVIWTQMQ